jgi:hypothetical protein
MRNMASLRDRKINSFAVGSFRDVADKDFIAARLAFRADLLPQFLRAAQNPSGHLEEVLEKRRHPSRALASDDKNSGREPALVSRLPPPVKG